MLELVDHAAKLTGVRDVRPEEDHATGLAGADRRQQRCRWFQAGVGVHDPLPGQLLEREPLNQGPLLMARGELRDRGAGRRGGRHQPRDKRGDGIHEACNHRPE